MNQWKEQPIQWHDLEIVWEKSILEFDTGNLITKTQKAGPLMSSADWSGGTQKATVCHPQPSCQLGMLSWLILEFTLNSGDSQGHYYCIRLGTKRLTFPFHYS